MHGETVKLERMREFENRVPRRIFGTSRLIKAEDDKHGTKFMNFTPN
jgi:hypothetical protein